MNSPRGSIWRKWDLHVHTPKTKKNDQYRLEEKDGDVWDEFCKKVEESDTAVFGITDYFSADNYFIFISKFKTKYPKSKKQFFPNVELATSYVVNKAQEEVNIHLLFNTKIENLEQKIKTFLQKLNTNKTVGEGRYITASELSNQSDYEKATTTREFIDEALEKTFGGKADISNYVLIFTAANNDGIRAETEQIDGKVRGIKRKATITDELDKFSDGFFGNPSNTEHFLKNDRLEDSKEEIKSKPVISGSDAHSFSQFDEWVGKRVNSKDNLKEITWLKADPIYDGLKQILYEPYPGERVFMGELPPTYKNTSKVIDKVEIKNSKSWFGIEAILLNENLSSVIGEKGSGKTALADFIAFAGGDFIQDEEDQASFIYKALIPTKQIAETIEGCEITLYWKNGEQDIAIISKDFSNYQPKRKIKYLSQSFIEKRCRPENFEELQHEIEDIIFQHIPASDRLGETTFEELRRRKTEGIEVRKAECRRNILELNKDIFSLEEDIFSLETKKKEKADLEKEQGELDTQKPKPTTDKEKEIETKLSLLNEHKNSVDNKIAILKSHLLTVENIKTKTSTLKTYADKQLSQIKDDLKNIGLIYEKIEFSITPDFLTALDEQKTKFNEQINKLKGAIKTKEENDTAENKEVKLDELKEELVKDLPLSDTEEWIKKLESISSIVESTRKAIKEYDGKIAKIKTRTTELEKNITDIETVKILELPKKEVLRDETYKQYFELLKEEKKSLEELYAPLKDREKKEKENQMEFFARIELDVEGYFRKAQSVLDFGRKGKYYRGNDNLFKKIKGIAESIELGEVENISGEIKTFYNSFEKDVDGKELDIRSQLLKGKQKLDFSNWFFDTSDFKVAYNIKYQGTSLELLSPGKKGVVLLLMYLVLDTEGSVPLVIDQPEENLDNKSVFPSLVDYFREIKRRRQVIVITHNPNLVLNTDAEQIIVANFDAVPSLQPSRISYVSGAIENSFVSEKAKIPLEKRGIREHGLDILEGGKTAFRKRREKYGRTAE
ncbi:MAG: hypothetical protein Q8O71_03865 [bacterium]|nr:hypothetical protein [bacterium]